MRALLYIDIVMWKREFLKNGVYVDEGSVVEEGVSVGIGCVIERCVIRKGAAILPYSVLIDSEVGEGCKVGPFAYLRPGSDLRKGCKVGAFVEVKKSVIGEGSKVPHLSYVGDALIGENVNIGCGVVFCNFDGKKKNVSVVKGGAFIGANVNLVAPIEIGEGALVAAGSTVTMDVGAGELAIARARQENKIRHFLADAQKVTKKASGGLRFPPEPPKRLKEDK